MHSCTLEWITFAGWIICRGSNVEDFLEQYGYIALLIGSFLEGESSILLASSLIHRGIFEGPYTVLFAFAGSFLSDWIYFFIGRLNGKYFIAKRPKLRDWMKPVQQFFETHQLQILFSYRFLYGFRIIIPLIIGMSSIRPLQFLFYSCVSGLIWAGVVSTIGYMIGKFLDLETAVLEANLIFIVLGFACLGLTIGYIVRKFAARKMHVPQS
jgi:membrane protein DedA with SNARE-associated domain